MNRDDRQRAVLKWVSETFGEKSLAPQERVLRVLEEAVELVQAEGMTLDRARAVVDYVFNKPPGDPAQEVGGLSVTLLAYCASRGILADEEEQREFDRVLDIDPAHFRARHNVKADAGIAVRVSDGVPSWSPGNVLHLKTQRDQPYGSERKCCERCGVSLLPPEPYPWTADERIYNDPPVGFVNCANMKKDQDEERPTPP